MKLNKMILAIALALLVSVPLVTAFTLQDITRNSWFIFIVNTLIIWIVLFIAQSFIVKSQDVKVKVVVWIATLVLSVVIAWYIAGPPGSAYLWEAGWIAPHLGWPIIVNFIIITSAIYFGIGLLGVNPPTPQGKIGVALLAILAGGIIANNIGDAWLWKDKNIDVAYDYLFGPDKPAVEAGKPIINPRTGKQVIEGGILNPKGGLKSRLVVFLVAALVLAWFLIGFLNITTGGNKLSIAMGIIIAASLAHRGENIDAVRNMAEILSYMIVLKQIPADVFAGFLGGIATGLRYLVAGILVGWVFCTAFGTSITGEIMNPIFQLPVIKLIPIEVCTAKECVKDTDCPGKTCDPTTKKCVGPTSTTKPPPSFVKPPASGEPNWMCKKFGVLC